MAYIAICTPVQVAAQSIFYAADPLTNDAFDELGEINSNSGLTLVRDNDAYWGWIPPNPKNIGFVFYPGCFYDERAYGPLIQAVAVAGYPAFLLDVPVSFSILAPFRADLTIREFNNITETWVIGGHGQGGAVAAYYAQARREKWNIQGLALFGAAPFAIAPFGFISKLRSSDIDAISLWGNLDGITSREKWEGGKDSLPNDAKFVEIEGGNHAQMTYLRLPQGGDGEATITRDEQQDIVRRELLNLMAKIEEAH
jgi:hypothetical protein